MSSQYNKTNSDLTTGKQREKKYKKRLFVGEGDFTYTEALINKHIDKHRHLAKAIVATELYEVPIGGADADLLKQRRDRIDALREKGVRVLFGVDGRQLHTNPQLKGERFERIHWNGPYRWKAIDHDGFSQVITDFFHSCDEMQMRGDRIHIVLDHKLEDADWYDYKQYKQHVVKGSVQVGYTLVRKRRHGKDRYPGYRQRKTEMLTELDLPAASREFIFEKGLPFFGPRTEEEILKSLPVKISNDRKTYSIDINKRNITDSSKIDLGDCRFVCSTDEDSSDYDSSA